MRVTLGPAACPNAVTLPNGASFDDGLLEDEAVLIALWNNAAFQELLVDLKIARSDLVQAGLLPNPDVLYFTSMSGKPFKYALELPIEAFWLRPIRIAAAERESARVCQRLTQAALDLIRDVRQAYADVQLAQGRVEVGEAAVKLRRRLASLAEARLAAGDISVQEATVTRIDALQAEQDLARIRYDLAFAEESLRNRLGLGMERCPLKLVETPAPLLDDLDAEALTAEALSDRPDLQAVEQNIAAAAERLRLARLVWFRVLGMGDATSGLLSGHEFGPAVRFVLPIFNRNQGAIARAEADLERAVRQRTTLRNQVIQEVYQAHTRYQQACTEWQMLQAGVRPEVEAGIRRAESAYREGNTAYILVLEAARQLLDSRLREQQLQADLRRAWAELERSVGRKLDFQEDIPAPSPDEESV